MTYIPYVTVAQVREASGGIITNTATIPDVDVAGMVQRMQTQTDGILARRYGVPFNQNNNGIGGANVVPDEVYDVVLNLAVYRCVRQAKLKDFGDKSLPMLKELYDESIAMRQKIAIGQYSIQNCVRKSQFNGILPPLDIRNLLPEAPATFLVDSTAPGSQLPTNAAGQITQDLESQL